MATWLDLKSRITFEEFMKMDEILEVRYINEIKVANYRKAQAEKAALRRR